MKTIDCGQIVSDLDAESATIFSELGRTAVLRIVLVSSDRASYSYARALASRLRKAGADADITDYSSALPLSEIRSDIALADNDPGVDGIMLMSPMPPGIRDALILCISPAKDIDCATPHNLGCAMTGHPTYLPPTVESISRIVDANRKLIPGSDAVIVNRSPIIGRPLSSELLNRDFTVTVAHSKTSVLSDVTRNAGLIVTATGDPGYLTDEYLSTDTVVIDAGTSVIDGKLVGDVAADISTNCYTTPVPGGVGSVTTSVTMNHLARAAIQNGMFQKSA